MKARQRKREHAVKTYAAKRAALKEAGDYEGLQKLPRNASPTRLRNRCSATGRPRGYMRDFGISRNVFSTTKVQKALHIANDFVT